MFYLLVHSVSFLDSAFGRQFIFSILVYFLLFCLISGSDHFTRVHSNPRVKCLLIVAGKVEV